MTWMIFTLSLWTFIVVWSKWHNWFKTCLYDLKLFLKAPFNNRNMCKYVKIEFLKCSEI